MYLTKHRETQSLTMQQCVVPIVFATADMYPQKESKQENSGWNKQNSVSFLAGAAIQQSCV
jgi:hypothetical protein